MRRLGMAGLRKPQPMEDFKANGRRSLCGT